MSTTRRPEDVTDEEVERVCNALNALSVYHSLPHGGLRAAIASGLLVPPPRERTQMEQDEEEWERRLRSSLLPWSTDNEGVFSGILSRLFPAAKAAGVTY